MAATVLPGGRWRPRRAGSRCGRRSCDGSCERSSVRARARSASSRPSLNILLWPRPQAAGLCAGAGPAGPPPRPGLARSVLGGGVLSCPAPGRPGGWCCCDVTSAGALGLPWVCSAGAGPARPGVPHAPLSASGWWVTPPESPLFHLSFTLPLENMCIVQPLAPQGTRAASCMICAGRFRGDRHRFGDGAGSRKQLVRQRKA